MDKYKNMHKELPAQFAQGVPSAIGVPDIGPVKTEEPVGVISGIPDSREVKDAKTGNAGQTAGSSL